MPAYSRANVQDGTYFFAGNIYRCQAVLIEETVCGAFREGIERAPQTLPFEIDAWVLLPDHLHCLWTLPSAESNFLSVVGHHQAPGQSYS